MCGNNPLLEGVKLDKKEKALYHKMYACWRIHFERGLLMEKMYNKNAPDKNSGGLLPS